MVFFLARPQKLDWFGAGQKFFRQQHRVNNLPFFDFMAVPESKKELVSCCRGWHTAVTVTNGHDPADLVCCMVTPRLPMQYLTELLPQVQYLQANPPEELSRFVVLDCVLNWLMLGTAIIRGKPKIVALELELRKLRSTITEYTASLKPWEIEVPTVSALLGQVDDFVPNE